MLTAPNVVGYSNFVPPKKLFYTFFNISGNVKLEIKFFLPSTKAVLFVQKLNVLFKKLSRKVYF